MKIFSLNRCYVFDVKHCIAQCSNHVLVRVDPGDGHALNCGLEVNAFHANEALG